MTGKLKHIAFFLLGALLALTSCRDLSLSPVFYTLSQEQPLSEDRGFPDETSAFKMVRMAAVPNDYYVAAANTLYTREVTGSARWQKLSPPPGLDNPVCNTLELFDGGGGAEIYAGFVDRDSHTGLGLWRTADLANPASWEQVIPGSADSQVSMLKAAGGALFVTVAAWTYTTDPDKGHFEYSLDYSTSGDSGDFTPVTYDSAPNPAKRIIDVTSDGAGTYWLIAYNSIYRADGSAGGPFSSGPLTTPALGSSDIGYVHNFGGLLYNTATSTLYLSATDGYLYSSADDGATWAKSDEFLNDSDSDQPIPFGPFVVIGGGDTGSVYVGTGGYVGGFGYYRVPSGDITESSDTITREPSYNIEDLYGGAVNYLFYDDNLGSPRIFLCMNRSGLWRGEDWNATSRDWTWKQE